MMQSVAQADVKNKKVLVRLDLDVPVENGEVKDLTRLKAGLETLQNILSRGGKPVIMSHAGRPDGVVVESLSLRPMLQKLMELLGNEYTYQIVDQPTDLPLEGTILALDNLRFNPGEEANDPEFAKYLASFGDIYVNDSFAVSHRPHASFIGVSKLLPSYAGLHLLEEVEHLESAMKNPEHPVVVVLGGAKVETKLPAINNMSPIADQILLGGKLVLEADPKNLPANVALPVDMNQNLDIGARTSEQYGGILQTAKTIIWNGPVGKFEEPPFDAGTRMIAEAIAKNKQANRIIGGGDTLAAIDEFGLTDEVGYVSTGGGAMLDFLAGEKLPGLEALGYYA